MACYDALIVMCAVLADGTPSEQAAGSFYVRNSLFVRFS